MGPDVSVSSIEFKMFEYFIGDHKNLSSVKVNYFNAPWQSSPAFEIDGYEQKDHHKTIAVH